MTLNPIQHCWLGLKILKYHCRSTIHLSSQSKTHIFSDLSSNTLYLPFSSPIWFSIHQNFPFQLLGNSSIFKGTQAREPTFWLNRTSFAPFSFISSFLIILLLVLYTCFKSIFENILVQKMPLTRHNYLLVATLFSFLVCLVITDKDKSQTMTYDGRSLIINGKRDLWCYSLYMDGVFVVDVVLCTWMVSLWEVEFFHDLCLFHDFFFLLFLFFICVYLEWK